MRFLIHLLINAVVVLLAAYITPGVRIRSFGTALWVAFLIAILEGTLGWLLTGLYHILTLGIFWVLGLGIIVRFLAYATVIRLIGVLSPGFGTRSFGNALAFAIVLAVLGMITYHIMGAEGFFNFNPSAPKYYI